MTDYNDIPDVLYYYCNIDDFIDLITNKRFKLIDLQKCDSFANVNKIIDILYERIRKKEADVLHNEFELTIPIWSLKKDIRENGYNRIPYIYAFILSHNCNKWYMYQKNMSDLCIGIRTYWFINFLNTTIIKFNKLNYNIKDLEYIVDSTIENHLQDYKQHKNKPDKNLSEVIKRIQNYINNDLILTSLYYKDAYFAEEKEYRLIYNSGIRKHFMEIDNNKNLQNILNLSVDKKITSLSGTQFMEVNNQLVSYRYLGYNDMLNLIDSVYINPTSKITESDLKLLLSSNNINFDKITKTVLK